jgi:hypothetical protein
MLGAADRGSPAVFFSDSQNGVLVTRKLSGRIAPTAKNLQLLVLPVTREIDKR